MNKRYSRQICIPEVGINGQQAINQSRVLIVGMGGLGCPAAQYLAAAGIGHLGIVDSDLVDETNLHRQILFSFSDIGKRKVEAGHAALKSLNPDMEIKCYFDSINSSNAKQILANYDIILDCTDNFQTKYLLNDTCLKLNKILICASATGFEGYLMTIEKEGPCLRCLYPNALNAEIGNCNLEGILGPFVGIVGSWQAAEALKKILNINSENKVLFFDFHSSRTRSVTLQKNPTCLCGQKYQTLDSGFYLGLNQLKTLKDFIVIDVRSNEEREESPPPIDSINIPHLEIISGEISPEFWLKDKTYVLFCNKGQRSATATNWLRKNGLKMVYCLENR